MRFLFCCALAATLAACGLVVCGPENCNGCCGGAGADTCRSGTNFSECGRAGMMCVTCSGSAPLCSAQGECVANGGTGGGGGSSCDASTCPRGCCDGDGVCRSGTTTSACGKSGLSCDVCATNEVCTATQHCQERCSYTCGGCCSASRICMPGTSSSACGFDGYDCVVCPGAQSCDPTYMICS